MMTPRQLEDLTSLIRWKRPAVVVEWGGGKSTWTLSRLTSAKWITIETHPTWAKNIMARCPAEVRLIHYDLPDADWEHQQQLGEMCAAEYVEAIRACPRPDLVIVDGRHRARCITEARKVLAPGGMIVLHDAQREHYHAACRGLDITIHRDSDGNEMWVMGK